MPETGVSRRQETENCHQFPNGRNGDFDETGRNKKNKKKNRYYAE